MTRLTKRKATRHPSHVDYDDESYPLPPINRNYGSFDSNECYPVKYANIEDDFDIKAVEEKNTSDEISRIYKSRTKTFDYSQQKQKPAPSITKGLKFYSSSSSSENEENELVFVDSDETKPRRISCRINTLFKEPKEGPIVRFSNIINDEDTDNQNQSELCYLNNTANSISPIIKAKNIRKSSKLHLMVQSDTDSKCPPDNSTKNEISGQANGKVESTSKTETETESKIELSDSESSSTFVILNSIPQNQEVMNQKNQSQNSVSITSQRRPNPTRFRPNSPFNHGKINKK